MKLAFVVQRYGATIAGGSEAHCRQLAERLASAHDITVLTTCATDYVTWANALPPGETREQSVRIIRFPVAHQRRMARFAELSDLVFDSPTPADVQDEWFRENGPDAPELLEHLRRHGSSYDLIFFWAFRYSPSYFGVPLVAERAILVPTAEEDPAIHLDVLHEYFQRPAGYLFLTPEEAELVSQRAGRTLTPAAIVGAGLDPAGTTPSKETLGPLNLPANYLLYLGRVDRNKGCATLLDYFQEYVTRGGEATLVLAGPAKMETPAHKQIRALGYVSDHIREALLANASALVVPSPYESLSMVLLEAWNRGKPALVNAECKVLRGQVRRANGGLFYRNANEFIEALRYLLTNHTDAAILGEQGRAYVDREYRWPTVIARTEALIAEVMAAGQSRAGR